MIFLWTIFSVFLFPAFAMGRVDIGLIDGHIGFLDDLAPAHDLRLEEFGELFGRARNRLDAGELVSRPEGVLCLRRNDEEWRRNE